MVRLLKQLATNAINWDTWRHSALGTRVSMSSVKPSLTVVQSAPASLPATDYHHRAGVKGVTESGR